MCVCVFLFVSFHGENRVKRVKKTSGGGAYFLHFVFAFLLFLSNVFECIFLVRFEARKSKGPRKRVGEFCRVSRLRAGWFEKNNFALFFAFSHDDDDAGRPGAFPNTCIFRSLCLLPKNGSECVCFVFVFVYRVQSLDDFFVCFRLMPALLSRSKAPNIYTIN